ncbi:MAG: hypothetical protein ACP5TL_00525 [Candidatus Micrarchaeia archaeon]
MQRIKVLGDKLEVVRQHKIFRKKAVFDSALSMHTEYYKYLKNKKRIMDGSIHASKSELTEREVMQKILGKENVRIEQALKSFLNNINTINKVEHIPVPTQARNFLMDIAMSMSSFRADNPEHYKSAIERSISAIKWVYSEKLLDKASYINALHSMKIYRLPKAIDLEINEIVNAIEKEDINARHGAAEI